jgi:hypothetical protein
VLVLGWGHAEAALKVAVQVWLIGEPGGVGGVGDGVAGFK